MSDRISLESKTVPEARREARRRWPDSHVSLCGYNEELECVYISCVRAKSDKHHVATASIPGKRAVSFTASPS